MQKTCGTMAWILACALLAGATDVVGQTTANGPYYATPSWDQNIPGPTRWLVLSNFDEAALLDRETGLVWMRSPLAAGQIGFDDATRLCASSSVAHKGGWRLPTINELSTVFDPAPTLLPPVATGAPFTGVPTSSGAFWSTSPFGSGGAHLIVTYLFFLGSGGISLAAPSTAGANALALCVRAP